MTEKNLKEFQKIAYDYHRLDSIDEVYEHFVEVEDKFDNDTAHIKLSDVYKQKYELFKKILEDEGYTFWELQKLEYEKEFEYYYALCFEPDNWGGLVKLIPFLSEEQRQQFMEEEKDFYEKIIPFDPTKISIDNNKE